MRTLFQRTQQKACLTTAAATVFLCAGLPSPASAQSSPGPIVAGCPVFPPDNWWNRRVDHLRVDPSSRALVAAQAAGRDLHLDLGTTEMEYGIPYSIAAPDQTLLPLSFGVDGESYAQESDRGPVAIPATAQIEGATTREGEVDSGDRHVIAIQRGTCLLTELYIGERVRSAAGAVTGWRAASAARWSLKSNRLRPAGHTSADAAGLPVFPGLLRYDEAASGTIAHALRFTLPRARNGYLTPARHCGPFANKNATWPAYGSRWRLKATFSTRPYRGAARAIVIALKRYGLMFADQGSAMYVSGTSDPRWTSTLDQMRAHPIDGGAFEVTARATSMHRCG